MYTLAVPRSVFLEYFPTPSFYSVQGGTSLEECTLRRPSTPVHRRPRRARTAYAPPRQGGHQTAHACGLARGLEARANRKSAPIGLQQRELDPQADNSLRSYTRTLVRRQTSDWRGPRGRERACQGVRTLWPVLAAARLTDGETI
eukprot:scaffold66210_cov73-Phaeocystis_antarctica.AAC.6